MQASLTLTSPLLRQPNNPQRISSAVATSAAELERDIKENIQRSVPTGRVYRRGAILARPSRTRAGLGLRKRGNRLIIGFSFHRASRKGQPPAIDHGRLINSIGARRIATFRYRISTSVSYALPLDDPQGLNRPFFHSRVLLYKPRFFENMRAAYLGE